MVKNITKGGLFFVAVAIFFVNYTVQGVFLQGEPVLKINEATDITATTANISGAFYNAPNSLYFFYLQVSSDVDEIARYRTKEDQYLLTNYGIAFQGEKKRLQPATRYYYRAVVRNEFSTNTYHSEIKSFVTKAATLSCDYLQGDWQEMEGSEHCNTTEFSDYTFCQQLVGDDGDSTRCCCTTKNVCFSFLEIDDGHQCECSCDCDGEDEQSGREFFDCQCDCRCYN